MYNITKRINPPLSMHFRYDRRLTFCIQVDILTQALMPFETVIFKQI